MELKHEGITLSSLVRRALQPTCSILICFSREGGGVLAPGFLRFLYRRVQGILRSLLLSARFWQFGIELCRVRWIDFSEKGKLQLKVTVEKRSNVKKRNQRQQKLRKTRAPGSITKKRGNKRAEHFDRSGGKHFCGLSSTRLNKKCSVPPAGNFLP